MPEEGGSLSLLCLASASGLPLFCRSRGGGGRPRPQLPFSVIGSLNGVHMFGAGADVGLRGAETPNARLAWGGYGQSITLIALSSAPPAPGPALRRLLDSAFGAMVLVLGLEELVPIRNVERLKRDLRSCFGLIDALLAPGAPPRPPAGAAGAVRGGGADGVGLFVGGGRGGGAGAFGAPPRVGGGPPPPWWGLPPPDTALLGGLLLRPPHPPGPPPARDLPVYLPHSSPTVPHRLLQLELVPGVGVALLCGPRPPLQLVLTQLVPQFWTPVLEQLRGCARPPPVPLPPGVLAYLLIQPQLGRTHSGIVTGGGQEGTLPPPRRGAALCHLYALMAPHYGPQEGGGSARLCYAALPTHTGLALLDPPRLLLLLLLPPRAPRAPLRGLALRALAALRPP